MHTDTSNKAPHGATVNNQTDCMDRAFSRRYSGERSWRRVTCSQRLDQHRTMAAASPSFCSQQLDEIAADQALRLYGVLLAFLPLLTRVYWLHTVNPTAHLS